MGASVSVGGSVYILVAVDCVELPRNGASFTPLDLADAGGVFGYEGGMDNGGIWMDGTDEGRAAWMLKDLLEVGMVWEGRVAREGGRSGWGGGAATWGWG